MPTLAMAHAMPMQTRETVSTNRSRCPVWAMMCNRRGTTTRAATSTNTSTPVAFKSAMTGSQIDVKDPLNKGMARIIGTTQRSWKTRMPSVRRPWGASISPRARNPRSTIAVLDTVTTNPRKTDGPRGSPSRVAIAITARIVAPTCKPPPIRIGCQRRRMFSRGSSNPIPNSSSMMPASASTST